MAPRMRRDQRIRDTHRARERQSLPVVTAHSPPHSSHLNGTILTLAIPSFTYSRLTLIRSFIFLSINTTRKATPIQNVTIRLQPIAPFGTAPNSATAKKGRPIKASGIPGMLIQNRLGMKASIPITGTRTSKGGEFKTRATTTNTLQSLPSNPPLFIPPWKPFSMKCT